MDMSHGSAGLGDLHNLIGDLVGGIGYGGSLLLAGTSAAQAAGDDHRIIVDIVKELLGHCNYFLSIIIKVK